MKIIIKLKSGNMISLNNREGGTFNPGFSKWLNDIQRNQNGTFIDETGKKHLNKDIYSIEIIL